MEIRIDGRTLDVSLENEKTIGEVLSFIEQWLSDSGHILSGLSVDGIPVTASQIEDAFSRNIDSVQYLDIKTNTLADISSSSLVTLLDDIKEYESLDYDKKIKFFDSWKESACARFLSARMTDLYMLCDNTFSKDTVNPQTLYSITQERLSEIKDPLLEFTNTEPVLNEICEKLIDLPLDIQTGKDLRAAKTIQLFTAVTEKIFRIFYQLDTQGFFNKEQKEENKEQILTQITEFTGILKELLEAYENNDTVLVGDLAEYEASLRIKKLYNTILENSRG